MLDFHVVENYGVMGHIETSLKKISIGEDNTLTEEQFRKFTELVYGELCLKVKSSEKGEWAGWSQIKVNNESLTKGLARKKIVQCVEHRLRDEYVMKEMNSDVLGILKAHKIK
jgi:hypothetical protein